MRSGRLVVGRQPNTAVGQRWGSNTADEDFIVVGKIADEGAVLRRARTDGILQAISNVLSLAAIDADFRTGPDVVKNARHCIMCTCVFEASLFSPQKNPQNTTDFL